MKFFKKHIGELVLEKLDKAVEACLAVAFFSPSDRMLNLLVGIKKLRLVISEEFTINNPYKLEKLRTAALRSIPPDCDNGKLHAKVLILKLRDGSYWALLGSANLTQQGMFSNQEACVVVESNDAADATIVLEIRGWFDSLFQSAQVPNLDEAKLIFDSQAQYVLVPKPPLKAVPDIHYWALKATSGSTGKSHWPMFLAESVIAVGWNDLSLDPSKVTDAQLRAAIRGTYRNYSAREADVAAAQISKFVNLKVSDIVLLCRGYTSNQKKDVHIHGVARVIGPFRVRRGSKRNGNSSTPQ
ncbi:MAG TPA: phospholipase D-like domain-containing protein [Candidatus Acidoferrales bacterium]